MRTSIKSRLAAMTLMAMPLSATAEDSKKATESKPIETYSQRGPTQEEPAQTERYFCKTHKTYHTRTIKPKTYTAPETPEIYTAPKTYAPKQANAPAPTYSQGEDPQVAEFLRKDKERGAITVEPFWYDKPTKKEDAAKHPVGNLMRFIGLLDSIFGHRESSKEK